MNRYNDWQGLLKRANESLAENNTRIEVLDEDFVYSVDIIVDDKRINFADNYFEDELCDVINDAWVHARNIVRDSDKKRLLREQEKWAHAFPVVTIDRNELRSYGLDGDQPDSVMEEIARNMSEWFDNDYSEALIVCATNAGVKSLDND